MSSPKCPDCEAGSFATTAVVTPAKEVIRLVHCTECGTVVGVMEKDDLAEMLRDVLKRLPANEDGSG